MLAKLQNRVSSLQSDAQARKPFSILNWNLTFAAVLRTIGRIAGDEKGEAETTAHLFNLCVSP